METPKVPVTPVQSPQSHDKSFKLSLLAGGGLLLVGLFSYFMAGNGGLFKGMIKLQDMKIADLEACVKFDTKLTQIKESGVYSATIQDEGKCGKSVQLLSDAEEQAKIFYMRIKDTEGTDKLIHTFEAIGNYQTMKNYKATDYSWNFGDGTIVNSATPPSHPYAKAGSYTVILNATVSTTDGKSIAFNSNKTINVVALEAAADPITFSIECKQDAKTPLTANCNTKTFTTIKDLTWSPPVWASNPAALSGGTTDPQGGAGYKTSFTYAAPGEYDVTLTINANSKEFKQTAKVTVVAAADTDVSADYMVNPNQTKVDDQGTYTVAFVKIASQIDKKFQNFKWEFGDGKSATTAGTDTYHPYVMTNAEQKFTAKLTFDDGANKKYFANVAVTIPAAPESNKPVAYVASIEVSDPGSGTSVNVINTSTTSDQEDHGTLGCDNGTAPTLVTNEQIKAKTPITCTYTENGTWNIKYTGMKATNEALGTATKSVTITGIAAAPTKPTMSFTVGEIPATPTNGVVDVTFTDTSTNIGSMVLRHWEFGDNNPAEFKIDQKNPTLGNWTTHHFTALAQPTKYTVKLSLKDNAGTTSETSQEITIPATAAPAPATSIDITDYISITSGPTWNGSTKKYDVTFTLDTGDMAGPFTTYSWDFGDNSGTFNSYELLNQHSYSATSDIQKFTVKVNVISGNGALYEGSIVVTILATAAPAASAFLFADVFHATADTFSVGADLGTNAITVYPGDAIAIVTYAPSATGEPIKIRFNNKQWNFSVEGASVKKEIVYLDETCSADTDPVADIKKMITTVATDDGKLSTLLTKDPAYIAFKAKVDATTAKAKGSIETLKKELPKFSEKLKTLAANPTFAKAFAYLGAKDEAARKAFIDKISIPVGDMDSESAEKLAVSISSEVDPDINSSFLESINFKGDALDVTSCKSVLNSLNSKISYDKAAKKITIDLSELSDSDKTNCLEDKTKNSVQVDVAQNTKICMYTPSNWDLKTTFDGFDKKISPTMDLLDKGGKWLTATNASLAGFDGKNSCKFSANLIKSVKDGMTEEQASFHYYTQTLDTTAGVSLNIPKLYKDEEVTKSTVVKDTELGVYGNSKYLASASSTGEDGFVEELTIKDSDKKGLSLTCINVTAPKVVTPGTPATPGTPSSVTNTYVTNNYITNPGSAADQAAAAAAAKAAAEKAAADQIAADKAAAAAKAALDSAPKISRNKVAPSLNTGSSKDIKLPAFITDTKTPLNFVDGGSSTGKYLSQLQSTYYNDEVFHGYKVGDSVYFKGSDQITLAEFIKTIVYFSNLKPTSAVTDTSKWYSKIMQAAQDGKLISSSDDPLQKVTIRQALEILYKAAGSSVTKAPASFKQYFSDVPTTDKDYAILQDMAYSNIYIGKYVDGKHNADLSEFMTRADVSAFLNNWLLNAK